MTSLYRFLKVSSPDYVRTASLTKNLYVAVKINVCHPINNNNNNFVGSRPGIVSFVLRAYPDRKPETMSEITLISSDTCFELMRSG